MADDKQAGDLYVEIESSTQGASRSLNNIIKKLDTLQKLLKGIDTTNLSKMTSDLNSASSGGTGSSKRSASRRNGGNFGFLNVAHWGATIYLARRLGRTVANIAQSGADYTETLNLWETAMGSNLTLATEFVTKMNEAYGISEKTLMNAQATFKNMLGGLGNITDQMAYALSEGITQMAVDYASLYNQTFEQAFTKFQAALAGQVRPIRSTSGMDITEQTLYALYQQLGGEKTMRQLNRTEKQLLSILAIFEQMSATGAVGDLNKTMNSFANQSRVMAESWQQVKSYAGVLLTYTIQESGLLTYVNAILIFIGDTLKAVAESMGAIQHFGGDVFEATTESALTASEAIDQVQGKLLDFDKFRSLSGAEENALGLDLKLLEAFSNFDSILANANMEARNLAENWKIASGLFDESGMFNKERWDEIISSIATFGKLLVSLVAGGVISKLVKGIMSITVAGKGLNTILVGGVIWAIWEMIDAFSEGDYQAGILAMTLGTILVGAWVLLNWEMIKTMSLKIGAFFSSLGKILFGTKNSIELATASITKMNVAMGVLAGALGFLIIDNWLSSLGDDARSIVAPVMLAVGAITSLGVAILALHHILSWGTALPLMLAGLGVAVASYKSIISGATSQNVDLSIPTTSNYNASNMGANINYTPTNTTSTMSTGNMKNAMYQALVEYGNSHNGGNEPIVIKIGEEEVFRATRKSAKRQGLDFVKV